VSYPRDLIGYGAKPPHAAWPGGARVAVQFVVNYEEGGENSVLHGDKGSEAFLSEMVGAQSHVGCAVDGDGSRCTNMARGAGFWRLLRLFEEFAAPVTVFGVASAMDRNPAAVDAMLDAKWEVASHGYKWIDYQNVPEEAEREHIAKAIEVHTRLTGDRPLGWYQGRTSP
jgi:peptidoglycan/xylan/chitin deacetylase (PgdA/CDA1 family)